MGRHALTPSTVRKLVKRAGGEAGLSFPIDPHMLRHSAGFYLANEGHDTRAIQHTVQCTELDADRCHHRLIAVSARTKKGTAGSGSPLVLLVEVASEFFVSHLVKLAAHDTGTCAADNYSINCCRQPS